MLIGGAPFSHGILEIFRSIGPVGTFVVKYKDFFYSFKGDLLVNGIGLVIIALIYFMQTKRYRVYGDKSITEIMKMAAR